jgi:hypothetical protein
LNKILLEKLHSYGISGSTNSWFQAYLANQWQFIEVNHSDARNAAVNSYRYSSTKIQHGVPRGSVLGPLQFLSYINDIYLNIHGVSLVMFADDINVIITDIDVGALQNKVDWVIIIDLEFWFQNNYLTINVHNSYYDILTVDKVSN